MKRKKRIVWLLTMIVLFRLGVENPVFVNAQEVQTQTLQGILICNDCVEDGFVITHTRGCCLMSTCSLSGYGILVPQYDTKSYKYYRFDAEGSDQAYGLLKELDAVDYLSVEVTGIVDDTPGTYEYQVGGNISSVEYDGIISNLTELKYDATHEKYEEKAEPLTKQSVVIADIPDQQYTGKAIKPDLTITDGDGKLIRNEDYTVSYKANINPGMATVVVKGTGAFYKDKVSLTFRILEAENGKNSDEKVTETPTIEVSGDYHAPSGYSEEKSIWSYVTFGSYPQKEETDGSKFTDAEFDEKGDTVLDGVKYHRISVQDITAAGDYAWEEGEYRYFRYEPIKWRVLSQEKDTLLLVADQALDDQVYQKEDDNAVTWESSYIRSWLNDTFYKMAFTDEEANLVKKENVINHTENRKGVSGGADTKDAVFLLSEDEIINPAYGYNASSEYTSCGRKVTPTEYAIAQGVWADEDTGYIRFWLRNNGVDEKTAEECYSDGSLWWKNKVTNDRKGVVPAIRVSYNPAVVLTGNTELKAPEYLEEQIADYSIVNLGEYPQSEITELSEEVVNASYDEDGIATLGDKKIKRLNVPVKLEEVPDDVKTKNYNENGFSYENGVEKYRKITETSGTNSVDTYYEYEYRYYAYEPIAWKVLKNNGKTVTLFSDHVIAAREFYAVEGEPVDWASSDLRTWLNTEFYENVFSEREKEAIKKSHIVTAGSESNEDIGGGEDTEDKVYLLSHQDIKNPGYGFCPDDSITSPSRQLESTAYADAMGILTWAGYIEPKEWWTRSMGYYKTNPVSVFGNGSVRTSGRYDIYTLGVAPVIEVSLVELEKTAEAAPKETQDVTTVNGVLMCANCATGEMGITHGAPYAHTTMCCLMESCKASGYGVLVPDAESKSYKFYKFDQQGDEKALEVLTNLQSENVKQYLTVEVTGIFTETESGKEGNTEDGHSYVGTVTGITGIEYDETHELFEKASEDISKVKVNAIADQEYTGTAVYLTPDEDIVLTDGEYVLKKDWDYKLSYENNINAGTAIVTVTGVGAFYKGAQPVSFKIVQKAEEDKKQNDVDTKDNAVADQKPVADDKKDNTSGNNGDAKTDKSSNADGKETQGTEQANETPVKTQQKVEKKLTLKSVKVKKGTKKITGAVSVAEASVKIKVGHKKYKNATVKQKKFSLKVSKLKKGTKVKIQVKKKGYKTLTESYKVK